MSGLRDIEFTQIAADWASITLGEQNPKALLAIRNGLTTKQEQDKGDYKVSRIETIARGWIDERRVRFVSGPSEKDVEKYRIQKGDILFSHINSDPHLGKTGYANRDYEDLLHGMNLLLLRANPEILEAEFLHRVIQYYRDIGVFIAICSRSVNQSSINQAKLKAVEIPLPTLSEQKKIAHVLSAVQRAIEAQERIIQTTTELKKALMHKLFTEGLRNEPQTRTEIGPVPESWKVVPFADSVCIKNGQVDPRKHPFDEMLHVGSENIQSDTGRLVNLITNRELKILSGNYHFTVEDVLYSKIRPYLNKVALPDFEGTCSADMYPLRSKCHFIRKFLFYYLMSDEFKKAAVSFQDRTGIPKINRSQLGSIRLACPPKEEQVEITEALFSCDSRRDLAQRKKYQLHDLFRTLLHQLMTAKTSVQHLTFETTN